MRRIIEQISPDRFLQLKGKSMQHLNQKVVHKNKTLIMMTKENPKVCEYAPACTLFYLL